MSSTHANRPRKPERLNKNTVQGITGEATSIFEERAEAGQKRMLASEIAERMPQRHMYVGHI